MNKANIDNPTAEDIAGWKEKHGEGKVFQITTEDGKATFYLKKPGRNDLDYASKVIDQGAFKFSEILMKNCWLGGSLEVFTNEDYFLEASDIMSEVVKRGKATLVKL